MSAAPATPKLEVVPAEEPTMFDSLARLVPDELQAAYYRVLAHTRTLSPDDEMLRILEAMGILALLTRHTPKDIADERERLQELLEAHQQHSEQAQQNMLGYVHELESRLADLPGEIEAGLDPKQIAKMLGESLRQHFLRSGVQDTVSALQTTNAAITSAQKELSAALRTLSDSHGGVVAQVERANNRIEYSLESRVKTMDVLLHEWKSDLLRIWIPLIAGAAILIGLVGGMEIQGCRDSVPPYATASSRPAAVEAFSRLKPTDNGVSVAGRKHRHQVGEHLEGDVEHKNEPFAREPGVNRIESYFHARSFDFDPRLGANLLTMSGIRNRMAKTVVIMPPTTTRAKGC